MADAKPSPSPARPARPRGFALARLLAAVGVVACVAVAAGFWAMGHRPPGRSDGADPAGGGKDPTVGGVPMFAHWPQQNPDLALVVTGQTYGYLSPCGCSRPQKGGLERRANFMDGLRAKGWTVVGLDLGDVAPPKGLAAQNQLKYKYSMLFLADMGYAAVGLGEYEFHNQLINLLAQYTLQFPNKPPFVLAADLFAVRRGPDGKVVEHYPRDKSFPGGPGARPMVEEAQVISTPGKPSVGVIGVIGKEMWDKIEKIDPAYGFRDNGEMITAGLDALAKHPARPSLNVLLYAGDLNHAKLAAAKFPQFQLVVCQSDEPEPPQFPTQANGGKTLILQVGQKGQNVGVVGVFKTPTGYDLKYQLVPMTEEYLTPTDPDPAKNAAIEANHKTLKLLQQYAADVKSQDLLGAARAKPLPHPAQVNNPTANLTYVGAAVCAKCHAAEYMVWKNTKHGHAYEALEKYATRPSLRQYDPECVVCHTTGFEYVGGFENETQSAHLQGNGCENCHGPGSGHASQPFNKDMYAALMPWKANAAPNAKLPPLKFIKEMAEKKPLERGSVPMDPGQKQMVSAVTSMCMKCHDGENDPKFDFYEYFPKVHHSGLKAGGLPPGVGG